MTEAVKEVHQDDEPVSMPDRLEQIAKHLAHHSPSGLEALALELEEMAGELRGGQASARKPLPLGPNSLLPQHE